jgi:uncharacterized protein (DUF2236 family)
MPLPNALDPRDRFRRALVAGVRDVLNDRERGETPVASSDDALYAPGSVIRRVHGDVTTMMIGGVAALLLQMLHPAAHARVWEHSAFRHDMLGRLRRTARFIAVTTYGEKSAALAAIEQVRAVHLKVNGQLADGTPYAASDPGLLAWVHVCEATCFLDAWIRYGEPFMSATDQDTYFAEAALVARMLGADPVPESRGEAAALIREFRPKLAANARTRSVSRMLLRQPAPSLGAALPQGILMQAAVDIMPRWAKRMHGLDVPMLAVPLVRAGALTMAETLRWAFRTQRRRPVRR